MKKLFKLFVLFLVGLVLVSCDKPTQDNSGDDNNQNQQEGNKEDNKQEENKDENKENTEETPTITVSYVVVSGETEGEALKFSYDPDSKLYLANVAVTSTFTSIYFYIDSALLDSTTTTVTGDFDATSSAAALYHVDDTTTFYLGDLALESIKFTYNHEEKTLDIKAKEALNVDALATVAIPGVPNSIVSGSASVYDAGKKLRAFENGSIIPVSSEAHVLYLIVDSEGEIVYIAQNQTAGYAGPGDGFYCHSSYKVSGEYNPVFNVLDTYSTASAPYWNHFEIVVPSGCFAVVAHGAIVRDIFTALGVADSVVSLHSAINDSSDKFSPAVNVPTLLDNNTHGIAADSIRVTLDGSNLVVYAAE